MILTGTGRSRRRETFTSATLSTTNLKWTDWGSNLGLYYDRPTVNRLSIGTAFKEYNLSEIHTAQLLLQRNLTTYFYF